MNLSGVFFGNQQKRNGKLASRKNRAYEPKAFARFVRTVLKILLDVLSEPEIVAVGFYPADTIAEGKKGVHSRYSLCSMVLTYIADQA